MDNRKKIIIIVVALAIVAGLAIFVFVKPKGRVSTANNSVAGLDNNAPSAQQPYQGKLFRATTKAGGDGSVFIIDNGKRRHVKTPSTLNELGGWGAVTDTTQGFLNQFPIGQSIA